MTLRNRQINVGFVLHVMQVAGAEVLVAETIRRLRREINATVFCLDAIGAIGEQLRREGTTIICLHRKPGRDWSLSKRLADASKAEKIDVMHAHQYTPFFYAALSRIFNNTDYRLIFTEHGRHYPDHIGAVRRNVNRMILSRYADVINACCRFSANALAVKDGFSCKPIDVIENGIDFQRYQSSVNKYASKLKLGLAPEKRYIACVARFHPVKDHFTLIKSFANLADDISDVELLLIGDGELRESLTQLCSELKISDRVQFLGIRSDVAEILQAVDIFSLTSLCEAASLTVLEAMASGLPVVITDVGGNPEMVRDGIEGFLTPRQDVQAIASAFKKLLHQPELALSMGQAGKQRVQQHYSLSGTIDRYYQLYRQLSKQGIPASMQAQLI